MAEEKEIEETTDNFYDEIRADVETSVYTYATLLEIDVQMQEKSVQSKLDRAKKDCVLVMCRGMRIIAEAYEDKKKSDEE